MNNKVMIGAGVLLAILLIVFFFGPTPTNASLSNYSILNQLIVGAERMCLSNTNDARSAELKLKLGFIKGGAGVDANASAEAKKSALRGASKDMEQWLAQAENTEIRNCMAPWSAKILDLVDKL